jgi:hypothetical protein
LRTFTLSEGPWRALGDLAALCRREGIAFAFVLTPESTAFRALYPETLVPELESQLRHLGGPGEIPLVNARAWMDDAGFWDGHHALPRGAEVFTDRLSGELLPLLRRPGPGGAPFVDQ